MIRVAFVPAAPAITAQPQSESVAAGANVQFSVTASGHPAPAYQWHFNGADIAGATSSTLSVPNAQPANAGTYTVTASNSSGSVTSTAATMAVTAAGTGSSASAGVSGGGGGAMEAWFVFALGSLLLTRRRNLRPQTKVLVLAAVSLLGGPVFAQPRFRVLYTFAGGPADGADPQGSVAVSGSVICGMTRAGGTADLGTLFKCAIDGTDFALVHSFTGGSGDGARPYQTGAPTLDGNVIYGMTYEGGGSGLGTIFRVNTDGSGFTLLHSFAGASADGARPRGSLTLSGTTLYGMTSAGGESGEGTVFRINTDGTGFSILYSFLGAPYPGGGVSGGAYPTGTLTLIGSALYGMARFTTYNDYRDPIVFRLNTDGTGYASIAAFLGHLQTGESLTAAGSTLYGMTGTYYHDYAQIFRIQTEGSGHTVLHTFKEAGVYYPVNTPAVDGDTIYVWSEGRVFPEVYRLNIDETGFEEVVVLRDRPTGSLTVSNSILYGLNGRQIFAVAPSAPSIQGGGRIWNWAEVGTDVTIATTVSGASPFSYQWQRMAAGTSTWTDLRDDATCSGTTTGTLTVHAVTLDMCGDQFRLVCSNSSGDDTADFQLVTYRPLTVTTAAGKAGETGATDGAGNQARFARPTDVAVDSAGNVFIADTDNHVIRKLNPAGVVSTIAGQAGASGAVDGTGAEARFNHPSGIAADSAGNVYVADTDNDVIRRITAAGVVSTVAGTAGSSGSADGVRAAARFDKPSGIVAPGTGTLFVADTLNHTIRQISTAGSVRTLAGTAGISGSADGIGPAARFFGPQGLAIDISGNLWVADTNNNMIRKVVVSSGTVTTITGHPGGYSSLDGPPSSAGFYAPSAIAVDHNGILYVVDTESYLVRAVTAHGGVSTPAGKYVSGTGVDGVGEAARFNHPTGIAVDFADNLYIADADNHTIRLAYVTAAPAITTQPQNQTLTAGANAQLSVSVTGKPALAFQWYLNGTVLSGATSRSLALPNVQPANAGSYTVTVTNDSGSVTSNPATLTVNTIPPESTGGNTGGGANGGGAMEWWFAGLLALLAVSRLATRKR